MECRFTLYPLASRHWRRHRRLRTATRSTTEALRLDTLKIDRSFVEDLPDRFEDAAIVRAILELARGLDLRVVAEGVETKEQLEFLRMHECREVQGFLLGEPVPIGQFTLRAEAIEVISD